jgi:acyl carrier protein
MPASTNNMRDTVLSAAKRLAIRESRVSISPAEVAETEPLNGPILHMTSLGLLGVLISLEDEIGVELPDDLFVGRMVETIADLADVILAVCPGQDRS